MQRKPSTTPLSQISINRSNVNAPILHFSIINDHHQQRQQPAKKEQSFKKHNVHFGMNMMWTRFWALAVLLVLAISAMAGTGAAAREKADKQRYDYIIVGGGTAGCPLAATLSEGYRVAILERGGNDEDVPSVVHERGFLGNVNVDASGPADAVAEGPSEAFVSEDGVRNTRARVLGGGSSINAGFYTRADPHFLRHPALDLALDTAAVNASYRWVEDSIVFRPVPGPWQRAFLAALAQVGIRPSNGFSLDHVSGAKIGGSIFDPNGFRHSAAQLLRRHGRPDRVRVLLRSTVTRVLFEPSGRGPKAVGVEYLYRARRGRRGRRRRRIMLRPKGEVVLSAGALGSPQLLMLSGVGPRAELERHGIEVVCDHPEVGQGMADNPQCGASVLSVAPLEFSLIQAVGITREFYVEASSSGPLVMAGGLSLAAGNVLQKLARPKSRGELRLRSADVNVQPAVRFNYLADARDLGGCARGMRTVAEILRSPAMRRLAVMPVGPPLPDPEAAPDEAFETVCRSRLSTLWHYHGGCVIGRVLDRAFRVRGVRALRVVDGSAFPASPGTNPQATVMMLGRYVGLRILSRRANGTSAPSF